MAVILICILISFVLFGCYAVLKTDEFNEKLKIHEKLLESIQEKLDLHKF